MDENLLALLSAGLTSGATAGLSGGGSNAASLATLLGGNDLSAFAQTASQGDILNQLLPVVTGTKFDRTGWDAGTNLGVSAGQAFLAGMMGNQARSNTAEQVNKVAGVLPQLYSNPSAVGMPEGVDANAWESLKAAATVKGLQRQALEQTKTDDMRRKLMEEVFGTDINALKVAKEVKAKIGAENEAYGYNSGATESTAPAEYGDFSKVGRDLNATAPEAAPQPRLNPNSPQYKINQDLEDRVEKLRKEFNTLPATKEFTTATKAASALSGALKDRGAPSDLELVRYSIQMIEPGMAVREGEQAAVAKSQSIPEELRGAFSKALNGESALSPQMREGIKRLAGRAYTSHKDAYDQNYGLFSEEAKRFGVDPARISAIGEAPDANSIFGAAPAVTADAVPSGMKLQRNRVTGETRLVPQ